MEKLVKRFGRVSSDSKRLQTSLPDKPVTFTLRVVYTGIAIRYAIGRNTPYFKSTSSSNFVFMHLALDKALKLHHTCVCIHFNMVLPIGYISAPHCYSSLFFPLLSDKESKPLLCYLYVFRSDYFFSRH
jgi:hypothetical protein